MSNVDLSLASVPRTKNGLIMPEGVVFYYLHRSNGSAGGCVCFGAVVGKKPVWYRPGIARRPVRFCRGISFCSRQDQFSRATGRELAYRRFLLAVAHKKSSEPVRRPGLRHMWEMSNNKSCFNVSGHLTPVETKFLEQSKPKPTAAKRRSAAKPIPLNAMDRHELKAAGSPQGARPRFCDGGGQSHLQWCCWQKLLRAGLAVLEGDREAGRLILRRVLPAAKVAKKNRA